MKKSILILILFSNTVFAQIKLKDETRDVTQKLLDLNPQNFNPNFSDYDQKTALYCAQLSDLSYWEHSHLKWFIQQLNALYPGDPVSIDYIEIKKIDAQVLLWKRKDFLMLSFRGTEFKRLRDFITDGKYGLFANDDSANVNIDGLLPGHGGFRRSLMDFIQIKDLYGRIDSLLPKIDGKPDKTFPIYFTGHSLGAGISQAFINPLSVKKYNYAGAYHFAPPLSVSCDYHDDLVSRYSDRTYDIVNYKDYVPRAGRNHVQHFGKFYRIGKDSAVYKEKEAYIIFNRGEKGLRKEIGLHRIRNHITCLRRSANSTDEINKRSKGLDHPYPPTTPEVEWTQSEYCPGESKKHLQKAK
jgi:Lipase (class 3)